MVGSTTLINRRWIAAAVTAIMLVLLAMPLTAIAAPNADIDIKLDGKPVSLSEPALTKDNRTFLPVAQIARMFDAQSISWDSKAGETTIVNSLGDHIVLSEGVPVVYFNQERYKLESAPFVQYGRMYVPLRDVAELLHGTVSWSKEQGAALLSKVQPVIVGAEKALVEIAGEIGSTEAELLQRNELSALEDVQEGMELRVVIPSIFDRPAKPYTEQDFKLLAKITMVEAGYESYEGQLAVANIILNRVKDARFPDSVRDVIYSGKQFPPAHNGKLDKAAPNASVLKAAKDALNGKNNIKDAVYFYNPKVSGGSFWDSLDVVAKIGNHSFAK